MWKRILEILRKEFRQTLRDPRLRTIIFIPPIVQTIIFGFAVNLDVERVRLGWMDLDRSETSGELRQRFTASPYFEIAAEASSEESAQRLLDESKVQAIVRVAPQMGADVARGRQSEVQILIDGTNSNTGAIIGNYAAAVVASFNQELLREAQRARLVRMSAAGPVRLSMPGIRPERRAWFNPELKSRNYFVPGIVANIIMLVTLMLTALSIVREKEIGTMEQIMVTPIRPLELILGKTLPYGLIGIFDMVLVTAVALLIFRIPFHGSFFLLTAASILYLLTTVGAGLFLSTISETQQQAMMGAFFFIMPAFMLSGFAFPIRNMPELVQYLTYINPVRYFMEIVRGVFLKGSGADILWPQLLMLAAYGVTIITLSALRFHKRMD